KAVQKELKVPENGLAAKISPPPGSRGEDMMGAGSDDIGDVSWNVPTVTLNYPANIPNLPGHNWSNAIAMATPIAHKGVVAGAKVMAMTMIDLLENPALLKAAKTYFTDEQLKKNKVLPLLADTDEPQIQINSGTMERFRPQMRTYYY